MDEIFFLFFVCACFNRGVWELAHVNFDKEAQEHKAEIPTYMYY